MGTMLSETFTTRERFRADLEAAITATVEAATITPDPEAEEPIDLANVPLITRKDLDATLREFFRAPLPPPDEKITEVRTSAYVNVWAKCPNCGIHLVIPLSISPQLVLESGVGELKLKAKSKGRVHVCGQLTLEHPGQTQAFETDTKAGSGTDVEDVSDDAEAGEPGDAAESAEPTERDTPEVEATAPICGEKYGPRMRLVCGLAPEHDGHHGPAPAAD